MLTTVFLKGALMHEGRLYAQGTHNVDHALAQEWYVGGFAEPAVRIYLKVPKREPVEGGGLRKWSAPGFYRVSQERADQWLADPDVAVLATEDNVPIEPGDAPVIASITDISEPSGLIEEDDNA